MYSATNVARDDECAADIFICTVFSRYHDFCNVCPTFVPHRKRFFVFVFLWPGIKGWGEGGWRSEFRSPKQNSKTNNEKQHTDGVQSNTQTNIQYTTKTKWGVGWEPGDIFAAKQKQNNTKQNRPTYHARGGGGSGPFRREVQPKQ